MNSLAVEQKDKWRALAGTLLFHALILLAFFLIVFTNPDPPLFSDNAGVEVNFGYMDEGMGEIQPEPDKQLVTTAPQKEQQQQTKQEEKEIITQEIEEAPEIMKKETLKKEVKKNVVVIEKPKKEVSLPGYHNAQYRHPRKLVRLPQICLGIDTPLQRFQTLPLINL